MRKSETPVWDELIRSDRKTLGITVRPDRSILLRAPLDAGEDEILAKMWKRRRWIWRQQQFFLTFEPRMTERRYISGESHLYLGRQYRLKVLQSCLSEVKVRAGYLELLTPDPSPEAARRVLRSWYRERATLHFPTALCAARQRFKRPIEVEPRVEIRRLSRRWGSCLSDGRILLNVDLIRAPRACQEYVIAHEICHLLVPNHSRRFFALLDAVMPEWKSRKSRLERLLA